MLVAAGTNRETFIVTGLEVCNGKGITELEVCTGKGVTELEMCNGKCASVKLGGKGDVETSEEIRFIAV